MTNPPTEAQSDSYEGADAELRKLWEDLDAEREVAEAEQRALDEADYTA